MARIPESLKARTDIKIDPTAIIEGDIEIGSDVVIDAFVIIRGTVTIRDHVTIGPHVYVNAVNGKVSLGEQTTISSGAVIYDQVEIGKKVFVGHNTIIRPQSKIGNYVSIGSLNQIEGQCSIGDYTRFHSNVHISMNSKIGEHCFIAPGFVPTNTVYPLNDKAGEDYQGVTVESHVKIGANVTTSPGVTIGKNSLIGVGSVVRKNIPSNSLAIGNPCAVKCRVDQLTYKDGTRIYEYME